MIDPDVEKKLAVRFKITVRPTLFLHDRVVVLSLPRMRGGAVYLDEIGKIFAQEQTA